MFRGSDLPGMDGLWFFFIVGVLATMAGAVALLVWLAKVFIYYFTGGAA